MRVCEKEIECVTDRDRERERKRVRESGGHYDYGDSFVVENHSHSNACIYPSIIIIHIRTHT